MVRNALARRNLNVYQKYLLSKHLIAEVKPELEKMAKKNLGTSTGGKSPQPLERALKAAPVNTQRRLGEIAGISGNSIHKCEYIETHADEQTKKRLSKGELSIRQAYMDTRQIEKSKDREQRKNSLPNNIKNAGELYELYCGDFYDVGNKIEDNSVDWIITDPPYEEKYLPDYERLAEFAKRVLKPNGSLLCMCGIIHLPKIISMFDNYLKYHWMLASLMTQKSRMYNQRVHQGYKPLLWYVKGKYKGDMLSSDVFTSEKKEKELHEWQQSEELFADVLRKLTYPNDLICDPFLGSATTGIVAIKQNRRFVGIEIDKGTFKVAKKRMLDCEKDISKEN